MLAPLANFVAKQFSWGAVIHSTISLASQLLSVNLHETGSMGANLVSDMFTHHIVSNDCRVTRILHITLSSLL